MKRILAILLVLWSMQVDAQPWFWGNATYQAQKPNLYWRWLDSSGTTMLKYIPNGGGLINTNNTTLPAGLNTTGSNRMVQSYREGSTNAWQIGSWGTGAAINIATYVAGGTMASPTATQATNQFLFITTNGYDNVAYGSGVGFLWTAATNWTNTTGGHLVNWDIRHPSPTSNTQKASIAYVGTTNGLYLMPSSAIGGRVSVGGSTLLVPNAQLDVHGQNTTDTVFAINGASGQGSPLFVAGVNNAMLDSIDHAGGLTIPKAYVYNYGTSSRVDSFATFDATTHQIVMAAIPTGGAFYDSAKMATQYRLDTTRTRINSDLAGKQAALGFTPENTANKATSFSTINNTLFPTVQACSTYVANAIAALSSVYAPISHTHGMSDLTGFNISTPSDGQLMKYDLASGKWVNFTPAYLTSVADATTSTKGIASFSSSNFSVTSGDVSIKSGGVGSTEIADASVTLADMANMATASVLGRNTAGTGVPEVLSMATLKAMLSLTKSDVGLANVDNTSDAAKNSASATLTNKTIDANSNTLQHLPVEIGVALSDETTAITTGTAKVTIRMPYAMTITGVRANVNTVSTSGIPTVNIKESGTTIFSTKLTIDANEKTSTTAATPAVLSDTSLADDAEITFDIDVAGTGAKGLKVWIIGTR